MTEAPLVSVVMPSYQSEAYIEAAIDSVLAQDHAAWELLVVDDGSQDRTVELARRKAAADARVKVLQVEHGGVSHARNSGLAAARGEFVGFLDADDMYFPHTLSLLLKNMTGASQVGVGGAFSVVDEAGRPKPPWTSAPTLDWRGIFVGDFLAFMQKFLFRRSALEKIGGFDARFDGAEDQNLLSRLFAAELGEIHMIPDPVFIYRYRIGSATRSAANHDKMLQANLEQVARLLADPRLGPALARHRSAAYALRYHGAISAALQCGQHDIARRYARRALADGNVSAASFTRRVAPLWFWALLPPPLFIAARDVWRALRSRASAARG